MEGSSQNNRGQMIASMRSLVIVMFITSQAACPRGATWKMNPCELVFSVQSIGRIDHGARTLLLEVVASGQLLMSPPWLPLVNRRVVGVHNEVLIHPGKWSPYSPSWSGEGFYCIVDVVEGHHGIGFMAPDRGLIGLGLMGGLRSLALFESHTIEMFLATSGLIWSIILWLLNRWSLTWLH